MVSVNPRPTPHRRYAYALSYLLMAAAGAAALVAPAPSVRSATQGMHLLLYLWDAFLLSGGLLSAFGAFSDRWIGEYLGLPLLAAVFAVYGVSALAVSTGAGRPSSLAGGLALASIALMIGGRWREVARVRRAAAKANREG